MKELLEKKAIIYIVLNFFTEGDSNSKSKHLQLISFGKYVLVCANYILSLYQYIIYT